MKTLPNIWDFLYPQAIRPMGIAPVILGGLLAGGGSLLGGIFGRAKAPKAAPPVDLVAEQKKAIAGNIANADDIEALIARANSFSQDQNLDLMEKAMPGYSKLASRFTNQANELLTDPYALPADVEKNIERLAAERGISAGTRGQFNDFSLLRDFGINSLQYGQSRIGQAQSITQMLAGLAPKVNPLSPMSFYVTPAQQAQVAAGNQGAQQAQMNAEASAGNFNRQNTWGAIAQGLGYLGGAIAQSGGGNKGNLVNPDAWFPGSK